MMNRLHNGQQRQLLKSIICHWRFRVRNTVKLDISRFKVPAFLLCQILHFQCVISSLSEAFKNNHASYLGSWLKLHQGLLSKFSTVLYFISLWTRSGSSTVSDQLIVTVTHYLIDYWSVTFLVTSTETIW